MGKERKNKFLKKCIEIQNNEAFKCDKVSFMFKGGIIATMPHSDPNSRVFFRRNGNYQFTMSATGSIPLPYGSMPRLILCWITTEAVKTKSKHIYLGNSLCDLIRKIGLEPSGGKFGSIFRLKEQIKRLLSCCMSLTYDTGPQFSVDHVFIAEDANIIWHKRKFNKKYEELDNENDSFFHPKILTNTSRSTLVLSDKFYNEVITNPIPFNIDALLQFTQSPFEMDLYLWFNYRMYYLSTPTCIRWTCLMKQFGAGYKLVKHFKQAFIKHLIKVKLVYNDLNVEPIKQGLVLYPSNTHVKKKQ